MLSIYIFYVIFFFFFYFFLLTYCKQSHFNVCNLTLNALNTCEYFCIYCRNGNSFRLFCVSNLLWKVFSPKRVYLSTRHRSKFNTSEGVRTKGGGYWGVLVRYNKTSRQLAGKNNRIKKRRGGGKKEKITIEKFCNTRRERGLRCAALLCSAAVSYQTLAIVFSCVFCAHSLFSSISLPHPCVVRW